MDIDSSCPPGCNLRVNRDLCYNRYSSLMRFKIDSNGLYVIFTLCICECGDYMSGDSRAMQHL
jgi:hypothetical protein